MWVIELILLLAEELFSWRIFLCLLIAIGIVVGLYFKYPEQDGLWSVSYPAAFIIVALGVVWHIRSERT